MMGYSFTEDVRAALSAAREEAARYHHEYVGTEHLLLGLVKRQAPVFLQVVERMGARPDQIVAMINSVITPGMAQPSYELPYTSRAKKVLELGMTEAAELGHSYVGVEHLLLGIAREEKGIGAQVLTANGITYDALRATVPDLVGPGDRPRVSRRRLHATTVMQVAIVYLTWIVICTSVPVVVAVLHGLISGAPSITVSLNWISLRNPAFVVCLLAPIAVVYALRLRSRRRSG
jgi:hypothetical protein